MQTVTIPRIPSVSLVLVLLASIAACGSEETTATGGLDQGKLLTKLSPDERTRLCTQGQQWLDEHVSISDETLCRLAGAVSTAFDMPKTDAEVRALCKTTYDACLKKGPSKDEMTTTMTSATCDPIPPTCKATVADLDACMKVFPDFFQKRLQAIPSCDKLTLKAAEEGQAALDFSEKDLPAPCKAYVAKCPGALDGEAADQP